MPLAAVEDQIVDDAALGIEQRAVDGPAGRGLGRIVGEHAGKERQRLLASQVDDGHVRNVEYARRAPHRVVFGHLRAVVERHRPAGEGRHARAGGDVLRVKRRETQAHLRERSQAHRLAHQLRLGGFGRIDPPQRLVAGKAPPRALCAGTAIGSEQGAHQRHHHL